MTALSQNDSIDDDVGLQLELGPPPVAPLGVVADGVARAHPEPLGDRSVLLQLLGELALDAERLESGLQIDMDDRIMSGEQFNLRTEERERNWSRQVHEFNSTQLNGHHTTAFDILNNINYANHKN